MDPIQFVISVGTSSHKGTSNMREPREYNVDDVFLVVSSISHMLSGASLAVAKSIPLPQPLRFVDCGFVRCQFGGVLSRACS